MYFICIFDLPFLLLKKITLVKVQNDILTQYKALLIFVIYSTVLSCFIYQAYELRQEKGNSFVCLLSHVLSKQVIQLWDLLLQNIAKNANEFNYFQVKSSAEPRKNLLKNFKQNNIDSKFGSRNCKDFVFSQNLRRDRKGKYYYWLSCSSHLSRPATATVRDKTLKQLNLYVTRLPIFMLCLYNGSLEVSLFLLYRRERPNVENDSPKAMQCIICVRWTGQFRPHCIPWTTVCTTWLCSQDSVWSKISVLQRGSSVVGKTPNPISVNDMSRSTEGPFDLDKGTGFEVVLKIQIHQYPTRE